MRLSAENLGGERGGEPVFSDVSFSLDAGQMVVVTGPNGSGKSTLLRVIAGLLPIAAGRLDFEGNASFAELGTALHYLGHQNAMKTALSVRDNLDLWRAYAGQRHLSIEEALEEIDLPEVIDLPYGYLSTGQRRRVAIAKMLVSYRPVWLLDEPTAGLDRRSEATLAALMTAHCEDGGIIIASTHLPLGVDGAKTLEMGG